MAAGISRWAKAIAVLAAVVALPLLGASLGGRNLDAFFRFPPPTDIPREYPRFSWIAAAAVIGLLAAIAASWASHVLRVSRSTGVRSAPVPPFNRRSRSLPWWGWCAAAWTLLWWLLAWTRWPAFAPLQLYTFFPLWLGFIVVVNALTNQRTGTCLMRRSPGRWLGLFSASAAFWWMFEWLNRFVRNWHYLAVEDFGPAGYALNATLCFSTVLPAVAAVREYLGRRPGLTARLADGPRWPWLARRGTGVILVFAGAAALIGTGMRPTISYPALWLAPLSLWWGLRLIAHEPGVPDCLARGDWRTAGGWMLAALICGGWWELWNWHSLARWAYTVPYVDRWHVFAMPLLGYAGYLSFGLECLIAVEFILADEGVAPPA